MEITTIYYSSHFIRAFEKLPQVVQEKAIQKEDLFRKNCFDPHLKTHKLQGGFSGFWSFSIDYKHRIIFEFRKDGSIGFVDIGPHSVYL